MPSSGSERNPLLSDATGTPQPSGSAPVEAPGLDAPTIIKSRNESPSSFPSPGAALAMPSPGDRIDSFELDRPIGIGGMGAVFLANDTRLQREVALKILPPEQSNDSEVVQRFYQEGRAAARLDHENIARVYTIGTDKGYHFIAFEYIEGATLRQKIWENGPLTVAEAINYTLQIAGALVHASERGVVHRDIKPSNIIITNHGRAKLVDMGLARRFERGDDDGGLTQSGMTLGTFDYISPEQARDPRDVDVRGDLYSLGCTLFHMLAGHPPFPEGTVLQKLLQHQEEPPPDVRAINPAVPADLSAILMKLMAKDRQKRYQTPELLVRDLLTVAGALGIRSVSPEGLIWMGPRVPPAWEKHLVWGIPTGVLAAVVGILIWWGQPVETPPRAADQSTQRIASVPKTVPTIVNPTAKETAKPEPTKKVAAKDSTEKPVAPRQRPRQVTLKSGDNLATAIAREASGSTFILSDDGPYNLAPAGAPPATRRDVTIQALPGTHPVIRAAKSGQNSEATDSSLLAFGPGSVVIEGVEFVIDASDGDLSWTAIRGFGTDVSLKACTFKRATTRLTLGRLAAVQLFPPSADTADSPSIRADACYFDGDLVAIWSKGPASVQVRDGTFGASEPTFQFDNGGASKPVPAELVLKHCSMQPARGPVVRSLGTDLRVVAEDCVVATLRDRTATLVETDDPELLSWKGKGNLYSGIETYLRPTRALLGRGVIGGFDAWADDPRAFREALSMAKETPVWEVLNPTPSSERTNPSAAFAVGTLEKPSVDVGARRGPRGRIVSMDEALADIAGMDIPGKIAKAAARVTNAQPKNLNSTPAVKNDTPATTVTPTEVVQTQPMDRDTQPMPSTPMPSIPMERPDDPATTTQTDVTKPPVETTKVDNPPKDAQPQPNIETGAVKTAAAFQAALEKLGPRGGTIKLAADAELNLPAIELKGPGRVVLQAEEGETRPLIHFRPSSSEQTRVGSRPALFTVRGGSLELQGVDVVLASAFAPEKPNWSAFRVWTGAELVLKYCTITIEARGTQSAIVRVPAGDDEFGFGAAAAGTSPAQVRMSETLLRTDGDVVDVAAARRVESEFTNCAIAAKGSLLHGYGLARGQGAESLRLVIRQATARVEGGLIYLESSPGEPDLPQVEVVARDVLISTDEDRSPLVRLDGQEDLESLRDRIKWDGNNVNYHRVDVYRRDQTARPGSLPLRFDRPSWDVAVASRDLSPFHGDAHFVKSWGAERPPSEMTRDDFALDPNGPTIGAGPDLRRLPRPPAAKSVSVTPK